MNYTEWVLERGETLWREREKMLSERLALLTRAGRGEDRAQEDAAGAAQKAEERFTDGEAALPAVQEDGTAEKKRRLAQKLGLLPEEEESAGEGGAAAFPTEEAEGKRPVRSAEKERGGTAAWMRESLARSGDAAAAAETARERTVFVPAQEREAREAESFSLSLERDARRYDGGFLYY